MAVTPFDSALWEGLYGDAEVAAPFSDAAEIAAMIRVERALALAGADAGLVPRAAAEEIDRALEGATLPAGALAGGVASAGVPVPALVAALRASMGPEGAHWLHWGATSQDIVDTGTALRVDAALAVLSARLTPLVDRLAAEARSHAHLPMAGRTRSQVATPVSFGLRVAQWAAPLIALEQGLPQVRRGVARVAFGGAAGSNAAVAPHGAAIAGRMAEILGLEPAPPHGTDREAVAALGGWLARLSAALGRMAGDLILMGRSEIGEAVAGTGGGSSTMPQKQNPVAAEATVALARFAAPLSAALTDAMRHQEERDATAWALEWLALPQLLVGAGAGLRHGTALAGSLAPDAGRMRATLEAGGGAAYAEAASFALARHMPRAEAQALVKAAAAETAASGRPLSEILPERTAAPVDWAAVFDPAEAVRAAAATVEEILAGR